MTGTLIEGLASMKTLDIEHIFKSSPDIHCVLGAGGKIEHINAQLTTVLGWNEEEVKGRTLDSLMHPDEALNVMCASDRAGERLQHEAVCTHRFMHKDGSFRWVEWSRTALPVQGDYLVGRDVTTRTKASLENASQQQLFEESLKLSKSGYFTVNPITQKTFWSEGIYLIHGIDPTSPPPLLADAINYYHPEDRAKVDAHVASAIAHGTPFDFQLRLVRDNDGQERLVHAIGFARYNDAGEVIELFGIFRDLTDDASTVRQEELEHFAYMASHDLREPLRIMRMYLGLFGAGIDATSTTQNASYWPRIEHSAARMDSLIEALSHYAIAGQRIELEPVSLSEIVDEATTQLSSKYSLEQIELDLFNPLPVVFGNHASLRDVFVRLLDNAFKFSAKDDHVVRVSVEWLDVGSHVEVIVRDNGPGFEDRYADRLFQPFSKLPTGKEGPGMGLAIVKRIIRQCDGSIWAVSAPGEGTSIHLTLLGASLEDLAP